MLDLTDQTKVTLPTVQKWTACNSGFGTFPHDLRLSGMSDFESGKSFGRGLRRFGGMVRTKSGPETPFPYYSFYKKNNPNRSNLRAKIRFLVCKSQFLKTWVFCLILCSSVEGETTPNLRVPVELKKIEERAETKPFLVLTNGSTLIRVNDLNDYAMTVEPTQLAFMLPDERNITGKLFWSNCWKINFFNF